jgi:hypothetical protein
LPIQHIPHSFCFSTHRIPHSFCLPTHHILQASYRLPWAVELAKEHMVRASRGHGNPVPPRATHEGADVPTPLNPSSPTLSDNIPTESHNIPMEGLCSFAVPPLVAAESAAYTQVGDVTGAVFSVMA